MKSRCSEKTLNASETSQSRDQKIFKVMKERVRRARISKSLEELKLLILGDSSKIFKLDQADILEFTVKHLRRLRQDCNDVKDLRVHDPRLGGEKRADGSTSNDLENKENKNICFPNAQTGCLMNSSTKRKRKISVSSSKIKKKKKLAALSIDIPYVARDSVITHTTVTSATRQSSLLVPICRKDCVEPTTIGSVKFVSTSSERTERKPFAEICCNKFHDVVMDAAFWRPWS